MSDGTIGAFNEAARKIHEVKDQDVKDALAALLHLYQELIMDMRGYNAGTKD